jgi:hypothetical protein
MYGPRQGTVTWGNWVELRGFVPLTPSMRTERAISQTGQVIAFAQLRDLRKETITASEAV